MNGAITSPAYGLMRPASAGTEPSTFCAAMIDMMPIIARRPLFTSAISPCCLRYSESFLVKPNGSHRSSGTGCG